MKRTLFAFAAALALVTPAAVQARTVSAFGINIVSCVVNSNGNNQTNGINVVYFNTHNSPATQVDFLVHYHGHKFILINKGSFTRGAQINANLNNALTGQTWDGSKPKLCTVQRVYLQDGTVLQ